MSYMVDVIQIGLLAFIAIQAYLLRRELTWLARLDPRGVDEPHVKGQTINVNVGTAPHAGSGPVAKITDASVGAAPAGQETVPAVSRSERTAAEEIEKRAAERARIDEIPKPRPVTTPGVKKCPSCGCENTTYRMECFNCGSRL